MFCPNCRSQFPDEAVFCSECGVRLDKNESPEKPGRKKLAGGLLGLVVPVLIVLAFFALYDVIKGGKGGDGDTGTVNAEQVETEDGIPASGRQQVLDTEGIEGISDITDEEAEALLKAIDERSEKK